MLAKALRGRERMVHRIFPSRRLKSNTQIQETAQWRTLSESVADPPCELLPSGSHRDSGWALGRTGTFLRAMESDSGMDMMEVTGSYCAVKISFVGILREIPGFRCGDY